MKHISIIRTVLKLTLVGVTVLLVACGGSSGSSNDASISGTIVAAPVNGADVSVVDANGNVVAGPVKTDAAGKYTLSIPNASLAQDLIVKSTGGTFTDEATGNSGTAGEMYAYASANSLSNGSSVSATPGSAIIANLVMDHGKTMTQAQDAFASAFGYTPDMSVTPADATTAPAADETAWNLHWQVSVPLHSVSWLWTWVYRRMISLNCLPLWLRIYLMISWMGLMPLVLLL